MSKFWAKCGKILTQGGKVVKCDNPPCGYYTVIGIKFRYLNDSTMEPTNECKWEYDVAPYNVLENKITWSYAYNVCLEVDRKQGLCGTKKIRMGCYEDCAEWDENWENCLETYEWCDFCVEVEIYNLAGCYDDYNEFCEAFYGKCGVTPDENGDYPKMWQNWYGTIYPSDQARECIEGYWNIYFCDKYMVNYILNYTNHEQRYWQWIAYEEWSYTDMCDCYNDYEGFEIEPGESCPSGYTKECYKMEDHPLSIGGYVYQESCNDAFAPIHELYVKAGGWWGYGDDCYDKNYPCYHEDCCDYVASFGTTGETGQFIMEGSQMKDRYCHKGTSKHECRDSNSLCTNWSYSASCFDNWYWTSLNARFHFGWSKVTCQKNDLTPEWAKGVKFEVTLTRTKRNTGRGHESSETIEQKFELELNFDEEYDQLPLLDNINTMKVLDNGNKCNGDCDWEEWGDVITEPAVNWGSHEQNVLSDQMDVSFKAIEYVK